MFSEIREIKNVEKEKSERERELERLQFQLWDCLIGSDEANRIQTQINALMNA